MKQLRFTSGLRSMPRGENVYFEWLKVIHFSTLTSSFSSFWKMTTWNRAGHNSKTMQLAKFDSVKRFWSLKTSTFKRDIPIKHLRNGIFVKSNTERFTEFTNCNLSQRLVELTLPFFNDVEQHEFPSNWTKSFLKLGERFFSTVTWVLELHTVLNQKKIGHWFC